MTGRASGNDRRQLPAGGGAQHAEDQKHGEPGAGRLSLMWQQRSVDSFLGLPFNIASYALLTHMLARQAGLTPHELVFCGGDCHVYRNHRSQVEEQLSREPLPPPTLRLRDVPSIFDYGLDDVELALAEAALRAEGGSLTVDADGDETVLLLDLPAPPDEQLYAKAMWHYGRGLARLHIDDLDAAASELSQLTAIVESEAAQELEQPYFFGLSQAKIARRILQGRLAGARGDDDAMVNHLRTAVELQDSLPYMEPPYWYYPVRQTLGAALLQAGRPAEAEAVFREDLAYFAENGWSLHGLARSLRTQGKTAEADAVQVRFEKAWAHADIQLAGML